MEKWDFCCKVCDMVGEATALPSGRVKVRHAHAPGCKVAKMERGDMCPMCEGSNTEGCDGSFVCLDPECGHQWETGDLGTDDFYENLS